MKHNILNNVHTVSNNNEENNYSLNAKGYLIKNAENSNNISNNHNILQTNNTKGSTTFRSGRGSQDPPFLNSSNDIGSPSILSPNGSILKTIQKSNNKSEMNSRINNSNIIGSTKKKCCSHKKVNSYFNN